MLVAVWRPIYVYVYVYEYANLLNLSSLRNVRKDTFAFYVYVYVATAKGLYYLVNRDL